MSTAPIARVHESNAIQSCLARGEAGPNPGMSPQPAAKDGGPRRSSRKAHLGPPGRQARSDALPKGQSQSIAFFTLGLTELRPAIIVRIVIRLPVIALIA